MNIPQLPISREYLDLLETYSIMFVFTFYGQFILLYFLVMLQLDCFKWQTGKQSVVYRYTRRASGLLRLNYSLTKHQMQRGYGRRRLPNVVSIGNEYKSTWVQIELANHTVMPKLTDKIWLFPYIDRTYATNGCFGTKCNA